MVNNRKDWNDIKSNDSWSIFKIMSEFVEAYDRMAKIGPCVSIFGSARTKEENPYYGSQRYYKDIQWLNKVKTKQVRSGF